MVYLVYCVASGKQEKVQACLVTVWLFIISCHSLSKTSLGSLCSWKPAWSLKNVHIQCAWNPLWKCVSLWLSKSVGRYANIENNNDGDGDGDGDDDPCKNALTAPEPLLASAHSFSNKIPSVTLKSLSYKYTNTAYYYTCLISNCSIQMYESTQIKWIPLTE